MDSISAFLKGEQARAAGNKLMVFDWHKAAEIIRDRKPIRASAGLRSDWEWTGGTIYEESKSLRRNESYTYLASIWATPELLLEYEDGETDLLECFIMQTDSPGSSWDADTSWPQSAIDILEGRGS